MGLKLTAEVLGPLLYVTVEGASEVGAAKEAYAAMLEQSVEADVPAILFDCRGVRTAPAELDRYFIATNIAEMNAALVRRGGTPPRIAVVATPPVFDPGLFLETVAVNRGVELRAFTSIEPAMEWLRVDTALLAGRA
jgi:hypothetical protein